MSSIPTLEHPIHSLLADRWSPRAFDKDAGLTQLEVNHLFEAARWAPSSSNVQPWRYKFALKSDAEAFQKMLDLLVPANQIWAQHASMLVLAIAKKSYDNRPGNNAYAWYDLGTANFALTLEAMNHGLYVHQMGGFVREKAVETFQLPEDLEPVVVLAIGRLGEVGDLPEHLQEREVPRKPRLSQQEFVEQISE
ncbi:MAG: nitroreductase family protein [Bacteroidia bacterium]|nr:nitroreductase family protein [Bacteroidia bacterium]